MQEGLDATINERVGGTNELHVNTVEERKGGELVDVSRSKSDHLNKSWSQKGDSHTERDISFLSVLMLTQLSSQFKRLCWKKKPNPKQKLTLNIVCNRFDLPVERQLDWGETPGQATWKALQSLCLHFNPPQRRIVRNQTKIKQLFSLPQERRIFSHQLSYPSFCHSTSVCMCTADAI